MQFGASRSAGSFALICVVGRHRKMNLGKLLFIIIFLIGRGLQLMKRLLDVVDQSE
jgi:hypothetical protein